MFKLFLFGSLYIKHTNSYSDSHGGLDFNNNETECILSAQSPIDIANLATCSNNASFPNPIELNINIIRNEMKFIIENDGYSLDASPFTLDTDNPNAIRSIQIIHANTESIFRFQNGLFTTTPYDDHKEFCFDSVHFHWGSNNSLGSEHTIDGEPTPLEAHFVSFSCDFGDIRKAIGAYTSGKYRDQYVLGVVGVFFKIGKANKALDKILNPLIIDRIRNYHDKKRSNYIAYNYAQFNITDLMPQNKQAILYKGSLTTPPCFEAIRWHVLTESITVSESQLAQFRRMLRSSNISSNNNFRETNALNGRTVYNCEYQVMKDAVAPLTEDVAQKNNIGMIIGIVLGAIVLIIAIIAIYWFYCRKEDRDEKKELEKQPTPNNLKGTPLEKQRSNTLILDDEETPVFNKNPIGGDANKEDDKM